MTDGNPVRIPDHIRDQAGELLDNNATPEYTMTKTPDDPTLEDALDALQVAEAYCENAGLDALADDIAGQYQTLGAQAPAEEWD